MSTLLMIQVDMRSQGYDKPDLVYMTSDEYLYPPDEE
jgi:hypothetical protein